MAAAPIDVAVIGAGYWGANLIRTFSQLLEARLVAVCDKDSDRLSKIRILYPGVRMVSEFSELLDDRSIQAVVVATPAETHFALAKAALRAGKHTFVEKPMASTSAECRQLIDLAAQRNRTLMTGHIFAYNAAVESAAELVSTGKLGEIRYLYSQRLNLGRVRRDSDAMWTLAPHDISIVLRILDDEPTAVCARGLTFLQENICDVAFLDLLYEGGKAAHIHVSWLDPNKVRKMTIVGTRKMIVYDDTSPDAKIQIYDKGITRKNLGDNLGRYDDFGKFQLIQRAGDLLIPKLDFVEPLRVECMHFVECIREAKRPRTDGRDGLRVIRILERASESIQRNGVPIPLH